MNILSLSLTIFFGSPNPLQYQYLKNSSAASLAVIFVVVGMSAVILVSLHTIIIRLSRPLLDFWSGLKSIPMVSNLCNRIIKFNLKLLILYYIP